jgi:Ca2+-binding RTX toxin-like protein
MGGDGNDVLYGGSQRDGVGGYDGDDVIYGGPGDDTKLDVASAGELGEDGQRDELYCGEGRDTYYAEKIDYVAKSCEVKLGNSAPGPDDSMKPIE